MNSHYHDLFMTELAEDDGVSVFVERTQGVMDTKEARILVGFTGELPALDGRQLPPFKGMVLAPGKVLLWFGGRDRFVPEKSIVLPAEIRTFQETTLYAVAQERSPVSIVKLVNMELKHGLQGRTTGQQLARLCDTYGPMPMGLAKEAAARAALEAHGTIAILGFEFSTTRFPLVAAAALVVLSIGILLTTVTARRQSVQIISEGRGGAAVDVITRSFFGRLGMWVLLPPGSVWLALPSGRFADAEVIAALAAGGFAGLLGLCALAASRKL